MGEFGVFVEFGLVGPGGLDEKYRGVPQGLGQVDLDAAGFGAGWSYDRLQAIAERLFAAGFGMELRDYVQGHLYSLASVTYHPP